MAGKSTTFGRKTYEAIQVIKRLTDSPVYEKTRLRLLDWVLIIGITLLYACVALYQFGSKDVPQKGVDVQPKDVVSVDLGQSQMVDKFFYYYGRSNEDDHTYSMEMSVNGTEWSQLPNFEPKFGGMYRWNELNIGKEARYFRMKQISGKEVAVPFLEMAFLDKDKNVVPVSSVNDPFKPLFDEQKIVPDMPTYMTGMYFDEIYHGRTAFEFLNHLPIYETTHPPLGKIFIALGIKLFGMNPFGWRIAGVIFGIMIVPVMYLLGLEVFRKTRFALVTCLLMTFDFMHFAHSRISTIDTYAVFFIILMYIFMYRYYRMDFYRNGLKATLFPLAICGIFFGLGAASKWVCIYSSLGLLILFSINLYRRYQEYMAANDIKESKSSQVAGIPYDMVKQIKKEFPHHFKWTIIVGVVFFIAIPFTIYLLSYLPELYVTGNKRDLFEIMRQSQVTMFNYHSNLKATHAGSSNFLQWPLDIKPIWFFSGAGPTPNTMSTISSFGNPIIWWGGTVALFTSIYIMIQKLTEKKYTAMPIILIGFLSQYLPWVGVSRLTFIYHYYASIPFIILGMVYVLQYLEEINENKRLTWSIAGGFLAVALVLFIVFFPVISGMPAAKEYVKALQWIKGFWYFGAS